MTALPAPILSKLAQELATIRAETASLEDLVSAGAASLGPAGMMEAQKLDHILQTLDGLTTLLASLSQGTSFEQAVAGLPLAQMVDRLADMPPGNPEGFAHRTVKLVDPELF
ncbi:hypothetical protein [Aquidulcibacter sp.]|uniref:hypothetical protein n=1 Tax=Aquidulcibacter sp. TaxID=2052990 RepID=UPI0025BF3269|nr:hypothetical protein [Aquidulcibacter sp.]MCA3697059.1 hypothetical protein [Aquidulcibacter sp.]